ncbi:MAG: hypothetical protein V1929_00180 [bacterium]
MSTAVAIPNQDLPELAGLPDKVKNEVTLWLSVIGELFEAEKPTRASAAISARLGHIGGFSNENILRRYYAFLKTKDWRVLVNKSKLPRDEKRLPAEFIADWQKRCMLNQRKCHPAYRDLIRDWRAGKYIGGYGDWRAYWESRSAVTYLVCPDPLPPGWTYGNLMRYAPSKYELRAARIGRSAAVQRPLVNTTRVGLKVGQYYVFDDVEHDLLVNVLGVNRRAMRPLELGALDLFSADKFAYGLKPTLQDELDEKKIKLKEREMRFLLAVVLTQYGYRPEGTTLMVEHGTAAIRDDVEQALIRVTNGAVRVDRSGMEGQPAAAGWFEGRGKGNFRFKAALESHHNLTHNETASLPAQLGHGRDSAPEELHGLERYNTYLLSAMLALPPERAAMLHLPVLRFDAFAEIYARIVDHINKRTDHDLEGWEKAGLTTTEYQLAPGMAPMTEEQLLALPEPKQLALRGALTPLRQRKLSPHEVFQRGRGELIRLPPYLVTEILGEDLARERRLGADLVFEFEDRDIGPGVQRFLGVVEAPDGRRLKLRPEEMYLTYCNPFASDVIIVCSATKGRGDVLGVAQRWRSESRADIDALHKLMGYAEKLEKELLLPVARAGSAKAREKIEMHRHNAAVLGGGPMSPDELETAHHLKRFEPADLMDPAPALSPSAPVVSSSDPVGRDGGPSPSAPADDTVADFSPENLL